MKWTLTRLLKRSFLFLIFTLIHTTSFAYVSDDAPIHTLTNEYPEDNDPYLWSQSQYQDVYGDFDGDGLKDVLLQPKTSNENMLTIQGVEISGDTVHTNGRVISFSSMFSESDWSSLGTLVIAGNFNGDEYDDVLGFSLSNSTDNATFIVLGSSAGLDFNNIMNISRQQSFPFVKDLSYYELTVGDVNGDGIHDLYAFSEEKKNASNEKLSHYIVQTKNNNNNRLFKNALAIDNKHEFRSQKIGRVIIQDFNSDGRSDIFIQGKKKSNKHYYFVANESGQYDFDTPVTYDADIDDKKWHENKFRLFTSDVNGDGYQDLVRLPKYKQDKNGKLKYFTPHLGDVGVTDSFTLNVSTQTKKQALAALNSQTNATTDVQIEAPTNLTYQKDEHSTAISVNWQSSEASLYILEQQIDEQEWQEVYRGSLSTYFKEKNTLGSFKYRVAACKRYQREQLNCSVYTTSDTLLDVSQSVSPLTLQTAGNSPLKSAPSQADATIEAVSIPAVPTGLTVAGPLTVKPYTDYSLMWTSPSGIGGGIYFTLIGEQSGELENHIFTTSSSSRNKPPGTYYYRVRACNSAGCSGYSAKSPPVVVYGTPGVPAYTVTPATGKSCESYRVNWGAASGVVFNYEVVGELSGTIKTTNGSNYETYRRNSPGTYYYKVRACNDYKCNWQYSPKSAGITVSACAVPPVADAGADLHAVEWQSSRKLIGGGTDSDGTIVSYLWTQLSGPAVDSWTVKNESTTTFRTPQVPKDTILEFQLTVTDNDGLIDTDTVKVFVHERADIDIDSPVNYYEYASNESLYGHASNARDTANVEDTADDIVRVDTNIYDEAAKKWVFSWRNANYNSTTKTASYTYSNAEKATLKPNVKYRFYLRPFDNGISPEAVGWGRYKYFYVNEKPVISGSPATSVEVGETYRFTPSVTDSADDLSKLTFSIENEPSWASFNPNTGVLTNAPSSGNVGTTQGIVISVFDGLEYANLPAFNIEVTSNAPQAPIVYKDSNGNLYVQLPESHGNKLVKLTLTGGNWSYSELTQAEWDNLTLVPSNYTIEFGDFAGDAAEDFRIINNNNVEVIVTAYGDDFVAFKQNMTIYRYDALGRLVEVLDPENGDRSYEYDAAGNRTSVGSN